MKVFRTFVVASILLSPICSLAVTTSPGKNAVSVSETGTLNGNGDILPLAGQILKGKAKTVVEVQATISVQGNASLPAVYLTANVNGIPINPGYFRTSQCDTGSVQNCSFTQTFWIEIDAAELISPGLFVGVPLDITLPAGNVNFAGSGLPYTATFTARVGKK